MLKEAQIKEIRNFLLHYQNPVFFFDNDTDGLCSFLLLRRYLGKGKGVSITSFPELNESFFRKVKELKSDSIVILDKPLVSKEFLKKSEEDNLPVLWIDHHISSGVSIPNFVNYYNPNFDKKEETSSESTTSYCYQVTNKKSDLWIAIAGSIADHFLPDYYSEFKKEYPDLSIDSSNPFEVLFDSQIGKISHILDFSLKDKTSNVVRLLKFLIEVKTPYEVLYEDSKNYLIYKRYKEINKKYQILINRALSFTNKKFIFFKYSGNLSISGELANELSYRFPNKFILVVYVKGQKATLSMRGKNIREIFLKVIKNMKGITGGGHVDAIGGSMSLEKLDEFKKIFLKEISS